MRKLKLQCFGHLMRRADSLEKTLMLGKNEGMRRRGQQRMRRLDGITASIDMSLSKLQEMVKRQENLACCSPRNGRVGMTYQLNNNNKRAINTFSWTQYHLFSTEGHLLLYISYLNSDNHTSLLACDSPRKSLLCQAAWAEWCLGSPPAQRGEESW